MKRSKGMKNKKESNVNVILILVLITAVLISVISGCSSDTETGESQNSGSITESQGEHKEDSGERGEIKGEGDSGEESGKRLTLKETYDVVRKGARLVMNYDEKGNSFKGIVENTTDNILPKVRVEVHLSNGTELGPTTPVDLAPGEKADVTLLATSEVFDGWTPHAEVGGGEHGDEGSNEGNEHGSGGD